MHAAAIRVELRIRTARSLKEKRRTVKSVTSDIARTFSVSVAEVDHHDLWQRTTLGIALVSGQASHLDRVLHSIEKSLRIRTDVEVLGISVTHMADPA
jgi:uncharacterized protein YlxP (DUF503 family)